MKNLIFDKPKFNKTGSKVLADVIRYLILIGFAYILLYPFIYMSVNSFKSAVDWLDPTVEWLPKRLTLNNYKVADTVLQYLHSFLNTFRIEIVAALIAFFSCALIGYGLARFDFAGKKLLTGIMIVCILIPDPMLIIASYKNLHEFDPLGILGLISKIVGTDIRPNILNTPFAFWLPALLGTGLKNGLFIYIYMQFFKGLPKELEEAAWIDGAGPFRTFFRVVLPSSGSATITVLVFSIVWYYNDYYQGQIYLEKANHPLSVMLANFSANMGDLVLQYKLSVGSLLVTGCFISIIPLMIYFLIMQRRFVQSIATCGIVG